jgi:hypothetical protein
VIEKTRREYRNRGNLRPIARRQFVEQPASRASAVHAARGGHRPRKTAQERPGRPGAATHLERRSAEIHGRHPSDEEHPEPQPPSSARAMEVGRWLLLGLAIEDPWLEVTTSIMGRAGWTVHGQFVRRLIKRFFHFKIFFSKIDIFSVFLCQLLRTTDTKNRARTDGGKISQT